MYLFMNLVIHADNANNKYSNSKNDTLIIKRRKIVVIIIIIVK